MNIRRGLFRIWLVASALWIAPVVAFHWDAMSRDVWTEKDKWWETSLFAQVPVRCIDARGTLDADYQIRDAVEPWNRAREPGKACWYTYDRLGELYPEYAGLDQNELMDQLYQRLGWEQDDGPKPFAHTIDTAKIALVPPFALLLIGSLLFWAFAGFKSDRRSEAE